MKPMTRSAHRPAFTLIELLVVMALIVTLAAITVGAVFRVQAAQRKSTTEATLQKIDSLLVQKLKTIQEQCRDRIKPIKGRLELAGMGASPEVGDAILMYAHTKNQLPMSFAEATSPTTISFPTGTLTLPAAPVFTGAQPPLTGGTGTAKESAVCLYIALSQLGNTGLEQQTGEVTIGANTYKCYIDSYGEPLVFNRLAFDGDNGELNSPPFVPKGIAFDPFYPKPDPQTAGTYRSLASDLGTTNANTLWDAITANVFPWTGVPGRTSGPGTAVYPALKNHTTAVISSGADKDLLTYGLYSGDNIVSYRLRKDGGKGD